jgi:hypothetical protein
MMWRWIVLALVAANGAFWLWSHGELRAFDLGPIEVSEPARLKTQIQPEALRVTPQDSAPALTVLSTAPSTAAAEATAATPTATEVAPIPSPAHSPAKGK